MVAKRALFPTTPSQNAKRIKRVEAAVYRSSINEVKYKVETGAQFTLAAISAGNPGFAVFGITDLVAGANQGMRTGNQIRLKSVEVTGFTNRTDVDVLLLLSRSGKTPIRANFTSNTNVQLSQGTTQNEFQILAKRRLFSNDVNGFSFKKTWNIPMKCSFTGPLATEYSNNHLFLVYINRQTGASSAEHAHTITYID